MIKRKTRSGFNIEYWMEKGLTEKQAKKKISEISKKGSLVSNTNQEKLRETKYEEWAKKMSNTKHYWLEQGYSEKEAIKKVKERQTTFTKEICIKKYGEKEGLQIWQDRQDRWFKSLMESDTCSKIGYASKESLKYFSPLMVILDENNVEYRVGIDNNSEYRVYGNDRMNLYDFVIEDLNLCFEYNGECFHPNPKWKSTDPDRWNSWIHVGNKKTAEEIFKDNQDKLNVMRNKGFDVYEIWGEDNFNTKFEEIKNIILKKIDNIFNSTQASDILF